MSILIGAGQCLFWFVQANVCSDWCRPTSVLIGLGHCAMCCAVFNGSVLSDCLWFQGLQPTRLLCPWGFSRQEYWSGMPCSPPEGIFPTQVSSIADGFFTGWATMKAQKYWRGEPIPSPGNLPYPGIQVGSPAWQADSLPAELPGKLGKCHTSF